MTNQPLELSILTDVLGKSPKLCPTNGPKRGFRSTPFVRLLTYPLQISDLHSTDPGYFKTALTEQYSTDPKYKDFNNYLMSRVPAKRWGDPKDLSGAVIFLASAASDYVSGSE